MTVVDLSTTYGDVPTFSFLYSVADFVLSDSSGSPGDIDGPAEYSGGDENSGVGDHTISVTGLTSTNYAIAYAAGVLTVSAAPLTVTPAALK